MTIEKDATTNISNNLSPILNKLSSAISINIIEIYGGEDIYKNLISIDKKRLIKKNGFGFFEWSDGSRFQGQFLNGLRNGKGIQIWSDGCSYEGEYLNDYQHGKGIYIWSNKEKYIGEYYKNYRHGYGFYEWKNGNSFEGQFYMDRRNAFGVFHNKNSSLFMGFYKNDEKFGPGINIYYSVEESNNFEIITKGIDYSSLNENTLLTGHKNNKLLPTYNLIVNKIDVGFYKGNKIIRIMNTIDGFIFLKDFKEFKDYFYEDNSLSKNKDLPHVKILTMRDKISKLECKPTSNNLNMISCKTPDIFLDNLPLESLSADVYAYDAAYWSTIKFDSSLSSVYKNYHNMISSKVQLFDEMFQHVDIYLRDVNASELATISQILSLNRNKTIAGISHWSHILKIQQQSLLQNISKGVTFVNYNSENKNDGSFESENDNNIANNSSLESMNIPINLNKSISKDMDLIVQNSKIESNITMMIQPTLKLEMDTISKIRFSPNISSNLLTECLMKGEEEKHGEFFLSQVGIGGFNFIKGYLEGELVHVDISDLYGTTALMRAAINTNEEIINILLDNGADVNRVNEDGLTALTSCLLLLYPECDFNLMRLPLIYEKNLNLSMKLNQKRIESSSTVKSRIISPGSNQILNDEITYSASTHRSKSCTTRLSSMSNKSLINKFESGDENYIQKSRLRSSHLTQRDKERNKKFMKIIKLLLSRGADVNVGTNPMSPLYFAIMSSDVSLTKLLLMHSANVYAQLTTPYYNKLTPLHIACMLSGKECLLITEMLLAALADPNVHAPPPINALRVSSISGHIQNDNGNLLPLHIACCRGDKYSVGLVRLLLNNRSTANVLCNGHSPLSIAILSGNIQLVKELLSHKVDVNYQLGNGLNSALACALLIENENYYLPEEQLQLVNLLVEAGADLKEKVKFSEKQQIGTIIDFLYHLHSQDVSISHVPFHALSREDKLIYKSRQSLLQHATNIFRNCSINVSNSNSLIHSRSDNLKSCYQCGRSVGVKLSACPRCQLVEYCGRNCRARSWNDNHKCDCVPSAKSDKLNKLKYTSASTNIQQSDKELLNEMSATYNESAKKLNIVKQSSSSQLRFNRINQFSEFNNIFLMGAGGHCDSQIKFSNENKNKNNLINHQRLKFKNIEFDQRDASKNKILSTHKLFKKESHASDPKKKTKFSDFYTDEVNAYDQYVAQNFSQNTNGVKNKLSNIKFERGKSFPQMNNTNISGINKKKFMDGSNIYKQFDHMMALNLNLFNTFEKTKTNSRTNEDAQFVEEILGNYSYI